MLMLRSAFGLVLALLAASCMHVAGGSSGSATPLKVMTYNIRLDLASDGANAWPNRKALVASLIRHEAPDIFGAQEVLLRQKHDLEASLPAYRFAGVGRDDGAEAGEFSPLAWRDDRFEVLESGTFWLSPTPSEPSKGWDAAYPRIATWALLRERKGGRRYCVLNTHFDHVGEEARLQSAAIIAEWAKRHGAAGETIIVMGDFNSTPASPPMRLLGDASRSGLRSALTASAEPPYGPRGTFNEFRVDSDAPEPIDHILVSADLLVRRHAVVTQMWGGRLPSDHYPVTAELVPSR